MSRLVNHILRSLLPKACTRCLAGEHHAHAGALCLNIVAREPNDYVCGCALGDSGGATGQRSSDQLVSDALSRGPVAPLESPKGASS